MTHQLTSKTLQVNGHELHYVMAGEGPPLVFLHGVLGTHRVWAHLASEMAESHTVIAPDLFGCGDSARPMADYSLGGHAGVVRDILDQLGIRDAIIVGHSLGGGIAMEFTYLFAERVEGLVLVASGGLGREVNMLLRFPTMPGAEWLLPVIASGFARRQGNALRRGLRMVGVRGSTDVAEAWHGFEQLSDKDSRRAFLATIRAVVGPDGQRVSAEELFPRMKVPALLVWGDKDWMIPMSHAQAAVEHLPDARLVVFEGAGHFPHLDQPDRFAALMWEFTQELKERRGQTARLTREWIKGGAAAAG